MAVETQPSVPQSQKAPDAPTTVTEYDDTERRDIIRAALAILAVVIIIVIALFFALSHAKAKGTTAASVASSTVSQSSSHIVNTYTGAQSYGAGGTVYLSGTVQPAPSAPGSTALVTVTSPAGTAVASMQVPVLTSGYYNANFTTGTSWVSGVYTVTTSYYNSTGRTTFNLLSSATAGSVSAPTNSTATGSLTIVLCNIYTEVHSVIFLLGLVLIVLGAAVYAFGHIMPGTHKSSFQGYGMGMIIGGVVGVLIAVLAPFILNTISGGSLPISSCVQTLI